MFCEICSLEIPKERLEAVPDTRRCVRCSNVKPYVGLMDYAHKTGGVVVILDGKDKEATRKAWRYHKRSR